MIADSASRIGNPSGDRRFWRQNRRSREKLLILIAKSAIFLRSPISAGESASTTTIADLGAEIGVPPNNTDSRRTPKSAGCGSGRSPDVGPQNRRSRKCCRFRRQNRRSTQVVADFAGRISVTSGVANSGACLVACSGWRRHSLAEDQPLSQGRRILA